MNKKRVYAPFLLLISLLCLFTAGPARAQDEPMPDPPGWTAGYGTHFELPDSPYLPVTLDSSVPVTVALSAVPQLIDIIVLAQPQAMPAQFTLGGLPPNMTFTYYADTDAEPLALTSDAEGGLTFAQDLTTFHHIWFQTGPSTYELWDDSTGGDCTLIGDWNAVTKTCTLTVDVADSIRFYSNGLTLDGAGHQVASPKSYAVLVGKRTGVTVRNVVARDSVYGIQVEQSSSITLENNTVVACYYGIGLQSVSNSAVRDNTLTGPGYYAFHGPSYSSTGNVIEANVITGYDRGTYGPYYGSNNNVLRANEITAGVVGITGPYIYSHGNTIEGNSIRGPNGTGIFVSSYVYDNTIRGNHVSVAPGEPGSIALYVGNYAKNNTVNENTFANFLYGLHFYGRGSDANRVFNNNFIDSARAQIHIDTSGGIGQDNIFNLDAPIGGNFFSDFHTPAQGCNNDNPVDSFCDAPYNLPSGKDNLPWTTQNGWLNQPPVAVAGGPYSGDEGARIALDGSGSWDPDGDKPLTYAWSVDSPLCAIMAVINTNPRTEMRCDDSGQFEITLTVDDGRGGSSSATTTATVLNVAPTAAFAYVGEVNEGDSFTLSLQDATDASPVDAASLEFAFDCGEGYGSFGPTNNESCPTSDNGDRSVSAIVRDKDAGQTEYTGSVSVANVAPNVDTPAVVPAPSDEGQAVTARAGFSDPGTADGPFSCTVDYGDGGGPQAGTVSGTMCTGVPHHYGDNGSYSVLVAVTDKDGGVGSNSAVQTVLNVAPTIDAITVPLDPVSISDPPAVARAQFSDPGTTFDEPYRCMVDYGDGTGPELATVTGTDCAGPGHIYAEAGVYQITVTVTDKDLATGSATAESYLVIYDPDGGFVTGGGWFDSPEGAYTADPTLTGKANFGFVSKYKRGATVPTGNTEFHFKAGDLNFHSDYYQWLVVAGAKAKFKGTGKVNGLGNYGFMISAVDAKLTPSTDVDLFRIKIWDIDNGGAVVYDNQLGADDEADPTTALGGGSIVVHKK